MNTTKEANGNINFLIDPTEEACCDYGWHGILYSLTMAWLFNYVFHVHYKDTYDHGVLQKHITSLISLVWNILPNQTPHIQFPTLLTFFHSVVSNKLFYHVPLLLSSFWVLMWKLLFVSLLSLLQIKCCLLKCAQCF